jgi:glycosyltransferase 2 family protein
MYFDQVFPMNNKFYSIGFIISIIFLILFFRNVEWKIIWQSIHLMDLIYIPPMILVQFIIILIRAKRWKYILHSIKSIPLMELYKTTAVGFMANYFLPARGGELFRAFLLGTRIQISRTASFATIVVERVFDGLTVMVMFIVVMFFMPFSSNHSISLLGRENLKSVGIITFIFYALVLCVLLLLRFHTERANRVLEFILKPFPERLTSAISTRIGFFILGLKILKNAGDIAMSGLYSVLLWLILTISTYILFFSFQIKLSFLEAIFLNVIIVFGISLPSAPGFIGTFHWACASALIFLGIENNLAKSYSLILWLISFTTVSALGFFILWIEGISLAALRKMTFQTQKQS